jgi:hypothetical protein
VRAGVTEMRSRVGIGHDMQKLLSTKLWYWTPIKTSVVRCLNFQCSVSRTQIAEASEILETRSGECFKFPAEVLKLFPMKFMQSAGFRSLSN